MLEVYPASRLVTSQPTKPGARERKKSRPHLQLNSDSVSRQGGVTARPHQTRISLRNSVCDGHCFICAASFCFRRTLSTSSRAHTACWQFSDESPRIKVIICFKCPTLTKTFWLDRSKLEHRRLEKENICVLCASQECSQKAPIIKTAATEMVRLRPLHRFIYL